MRNASGLTLIELIFGLAIIAILAGLAMPGFRQTLRAAAVRAATYELLAGLQQTRGGSIVESQPALLCPSDSAGNCLPPATAGAFWRWSIETPGRLPELEGRALPEGVVALSSRSPIRFSPNALSASNATLTICDLQGIAPPRAIIISVTGRARISTEATSTCR
jgi:type IV fimbrial biogenesis protein FimT